MFTSMFMSSFAKLSTGNVQLDVFAQMAVWALIMALSSANTRAFIIFVVESLFKNGRSKSSIDLIYNPNIGDNPAFSSVSFFIERNAKAQFLRTAQVKPNYYNQDDHKSVSYSMYGTESIELTGDIHCRYFETSTTTENFGDIVIETIRLYSTHRDIAHLIKFVKMCETELTRHLSDILKVRSIIDVSRSHAKKSEEPAVALKIVHMPWSSSATFNNRFFDDKKEIIQKIELFLNNKEWYKNKGIPHTMGFLLWGEPGCGKTSFIKALANHDMFRGKHILNIRLSKNFDLDELSRILSNEKISTGVIVPLDKRIIVFEDIDCMCDMVTDRRDEDPPTSGDAVAVGIKALAKLAADITDANTTSNANNNLSNLLNIIDGLTESSERIIIMTSNHPEKLDRALTRSGRIDVTVHFQKASCAQIQEIVGHYWDAPQPRELDASLERAISAADVVNACRSSKSAEESYANIETRIAESVPIV